MIIPLEHPSSSISQMTNSINFSKKYWWYHYKLHLLILFNRPHFCNIWLLGFSYLSLCCSFNAVQKIVDSVAYIFTKQVRKRDPIKNRIKNDFDQLGNKNNSQVTEIEFCWIFFSFVFLQSNIDRYSGFIDESEAR